MTAQFPGLAGLGWSYHKTPTWRTNVASHVSGREARTALYSNPIWNFELTFDALASAPGYPGLGATSLQTLMGLYLKMQGQYGSFNFLDPTDYQITSPQTFGTGDGATTSFQLIRNMGDQFKEAIGSPWIPASPTTIPFPNAVSLYPPMNLWINSIATASLNSGMSATNATFTSAQADPDGGSLATLVTETTDTGAHTGEQGAIPIPAAATLRFSACLQDAANEQYVSLVLGNGSNRFMATFDLDNGAVTQTAAAGSGSVAGAAIANAGGGYWLCSVLGTVDSSDTSATGYIVAAGGSATPAAFPSYAGSTGSSFLVAFPQVEVVTASASATPDLFVPTLATINYGGPVITDAGALVDPSDYTIANGLVAFTTAPSSGDALQWSGIFQFLCRFDDDSADFEEFMQNLWTVKSIKLRSLRFS